MSAKTGSIPDESQNIEKSLESESPTSGPRTPPSPSVGQSVHDKKRRRTSSPAASLQQDTAVGGPRLSRSRRPTYRQYNDSFGPPLGGVAGSLRSSASFISSVTGRPLRQKDVFLTQHSGWVSRKGLPATAERHRMLTGQLYTHLEVSLGQDRARCERALERYNHVSRPASGFSSAETMLSLTQIVDPSEDTLNPSRHLNMRECAGLIGTDTTIQSPFTCSYGYNLRIGDQVFMVQHWIAREDHHQRHRPPSGEPQGSGGPVPGTVGDHWSRRSHWRRRVYCTWCRDRTGVAD